MPKPRRSRREGLDDVKTDFLVRRRGVLAERDLAASPQPVSAPPVGLPTRRGCPEGGSPSPPPMKCLPRRQIFESTAASCQPAYARRSAPRLSCFAGCGCGGAEQRVSEARPVAPHSPLVTNDEMTAAPHHARPATARPASAERRAMLSRLEHL